MMAFDEANAKGGVNGYKIVVTPYDDGTATAGQYDPAQAATNARKMVSDKATVAAIGPQMSGAGKAMAPILSEGDLAIITPSSTNPDITDPKFAAQYRPEGKAIYFRTVATDAYQGPYMANYYADVLHVKTVYVLDDSGAYGVGLADAFQAQAEKKGIKILGRDRLDPKAADYSAVLTKIKSLNPDAIYYGGVLQAGVKLAKQAYDIVPKMIKGGGDGMDGPEMLTAVGYPANEGWYATVASPHVTEDAKMADWVKAYKNKYIDPDDYAVTSLRCGDGHSGRDQEDYRRGEGAHPGRRARRDPGGEGGHAARPGLVRCQRRPGGQDDQRLPDQAGQEHPAGGHAAIPLYRRGAVGLTP